MDILMDGLKLSTIGFMAVVGFLVVVIGAMHLNHFLTKPFEHMLEDKKAPPAPKKDNDEELQRMAVAAAAAVHLHRNK